MRRDQQVPALPRLFERHSCISTSPFPLESGGVTVTPLVRLARVGHEVINGPLMGLEFVDEAMRAAEGRRGRFCHESRFRSRQAASAG